MSDARWIEVDGDFSGAARHFGRAAALHEAGGFDAPGLDGYRAQMAFMHAMQAAHTSLENGLLRILEMLGEERPVGGNWHADLIRRAARPLPGVRPAILSEPLARAADEARRFRNLAVRGYESFDPRQSGPAIRAAEALSEGMAEALRLFRAAMDQD
ncbi:MAG: hypothetical protein ABI369_12615 [Acetobacteraceae bacterium]